MDCESLINAVFLRDALWNNRNADHHNNFVLNRLWEEVATQFMCDRDEVRKKWKTLRDSYQRHLHNSMARSGSAAKKPIPWPYYQQMSFLKDTMMAKEMHSNLPNLPDTEIDDHSDNHSGSPTLQPRVSQSLAPTAPVTRVSRGCNSAISSSSSSSSTNSNRIAISSNSKSLDPPPVPRSDRSDAVRKNSRDSWGKELLNVEKRKLELLQTQEQSKKARTTDDNSDDELFFKSLLPMIRNLPATKKLRYRMKLLQFTEQFLLADENSAELIIEHLSPIDVNSFINIECDS